MRVLTLLILAVAWAAPARADDALTDMERHNVVMRVLEGNLEYLRQIEPDARTADDLFPFAVRDLWWRPDPGAAGRYESFETAEGLLGKRYRWLLEPGQQDAYPSPEVGETDTWPILSALIEDRIRRESRGPAGLPEDSPITTIAELMGALDTGPGLGENARHRLWYLDNSRHQLSVVVHGAEPLEAELIAADDAASIRLRNGVLALLSVILLLGATLIAARRGPAASTS